MILKVLFVVLVLGAPSAPKNVENFQREIEGDDPVVETKNGQVRGNRNKTVGLGKTYYSFRGIPFAKPPIGDLRFEPPVPTDKWTGILNATHDPPTCIQISPPYSGSEDCLYLNVYTPNISPNKLLSVMVWIYGGGFVGGDSKYSTYGPDYLLDENVVIVTINYRLGIFGFLSTNDLVVPGNMGLKDQVLAMKWVKSNIDRFGGDPNNITIFGESAGSASVSYHLQSNLSKGLFNAAIMESGHSLCIWALYRLIEQTLDFLSITLLIDRSNTTSFVNHLKNTDSHILQQKSYDAFFALLLQYTMLNGLIFGPVIEPDHNGAFFSSKSYELLKNGHFHQVPVIIGFNSLELNIDVTIPIRIYAIRFNADESSLVPVDMNIKNIVEKLAVGDNIKKYYFGIVPISIDSKGLIQYLSDSQFNRPIRKAVSLTSKYAPVYYYKFAYVGKLGNGKNKEYSSGVQHAEELNYIWRRNIEGTKDDNITRSRVVRLWTNFAKYGNPTPVLDPLLQNQTWPLATSENDFNLFEINKNLKVKDSVTKNLLYWDKLYNKYGNSPYDTY